MKKRTRFKFSWIFILLGGVWGLLCVLLFNEKAIRIIALIAGSTLLGYTGANIDIIRERKSRKEAKKNENQNHDDKRKFRV